MNAHRPLSTLAGMSLAVAIAAATHAQSYHTYPQIEAALAAAALNHPDICRRVSLGKTTLNREMWAVCISDNPLIDEDEPEFRYVSSLHGDEIIGVEMCLNLVEHLTDGYGSDPRSTRLVDEVEIWIVPCANPDGFVAAARGNAHGVDLNRNFPCPYASPTNTPDGREPETANLMNWAFGRSFTLAANFHSGALVVNYPFDANASGAAVDTPSPDDDLFVWVSEEYSRHNLPMWNSPSFFHGITNGADWYVIYGGMQDWSYAYMGCNEVTIELANSTPSAAQIPTYWNNNRESMLAYMETCLVGVRGIVTDAQTAAPLAASVSVVGREHDVFSDPDVGDYHRMLLPGTYTLRFDAPGHDGRTIGGVVVSAGGATRLDVALGPPAQVVSPNGGEALVVGRSAQVAWSGPADARFQIQATLNAGATASTVDGFESGTLNPLFSTGGNAAWTVTTSSARTGTRSARAGAITHRGESWLRRTVNGPGQMQFWYRVSSEPDYDFFTFYIDGQTQLRRSGSVGWTQFSTALDPGPHEIEWGYTKDGSVSTGSDTVWIDDAELVEDATLWTDVLAETAVGALTADWTPVAATESALVRVRALYGESRDPGYWDESDGTFAVVPAPCTGDVDGDRDVDLSDLARLLANYGVASGAQPGDGDLDGDGDVDLSDLSRLLGNFGTSCR